MYCIVCDTSSQHYSGADWVCAGIYVLSTGTPFEDRASNLATSGTIMTILISVGILGVPNAFKHAGWCHPISAPCKCLSFAARIPGVLTLSSGVVTLSSGVLTLSSYALTLSSCAGWLGGPLILAICITTANQCGTQLTLFLYLQPQLSLRHRAVCLTDQLNKSSISE